MFTALIINQYAFLSEAQSTENTDLECNLVFDGESANESISFQTSLEAKSTWKRSKFKPKGFNKRKSYRMEDNRDNPFC